MEYQKICYVAWNCRGFCDSLKTQMGIVSLTLAYSLCWRIQWSAYLEESDQLCQLVTAFTDLVGDVQSKGGLL